MKHPLVQTFVKTLITCSCLLSFSNILPAVATGPLVKASGSTVYYATADGGRYFFPNESVYKSWYSGFDAVTKVTDGDLASMSLRGNILYRPGSVLIKITTDPKVYAVSRYGMLRWVTTEQIAKALYGDAWNTRVVDVPDTYFSNYLVDQPILNASDYSVIGELNSATIPQENIRPNAFVPPSQSGIAPPTQTPVLQAAVSLSSDSAVQNQDVEISATVTAHTSMITKMEIRSDESATVLQTCLNTTICTHRYTVTQAPRTVHFSAVVTDALGRVFTTPNAERPALTVPATSDQVQLSASQQTISMGNKTGFTSSINGLSGITSHKIFALIPGEYTPVLWKDCGISTLCAGSTVFYRTTSLYADVLVNGEHKLSRPITINVVGGAAPKPTLAVTAHPSPNHVQLFIHAPSGEMITTTAITDGPSIDDPALALCDGDCTLVVQIIKQSGITAHTWVGGKYENSETVMVMP